MTNLGGYDFSRMTKGLNVLTEGYIDYAKEVIINRALPSLYDGLKPVQRRVLYTLHSKFKKNDKVKSADLVGRTMKLHPHGDGSIYSALVLLTDANGSLTVPLLQGQGNFGSVNTSDPPAASRYTEVRMHENAQEYFKDIDYIDLVPNYDSSDKEADLLPVTYPAVLCNVQNGIAVGFSCNTPSFNFNDVIDLTIECIRDGKCSTVICPDFTTGGYYVKNNKELDKLMRTGKAKLKLRGKVTKVGKALTVVEFPYGVKVQDLLEQIKQANIAGISDCGDTSDFEHGASLYIDCKTGRADEVLYSLFRDTDLQCNFSASMFTILNDNPVCLGVWGIVEEWVKWRKALVEKKLKHEREAIVAEMAQSRAFIEVFNDKEKLDQLIHLVTKVSDDEAIKFLLENFDNEIVTPEYANWIINRRAKTFRDGGKYISRYNDLSNMLGACDYNIEHIDEYLIRQLTELKAAKGHLYPRHTEVTTTDYEFKVEENVPVKDTTECYYTFKDGFLKKSRFPSGEEDYEYKFTALACDTLIATDNRGRVLRIYCEDLPYTGIGELGIYLPKYLEINETADDYKINWIGVLDGSTKMLLYKDGNVGFLDTSEWVGHNRRVRVIEKGIAVSIADKLGAVLDEIPEWLFVCDTNGKLGYVATDTIKRKDRTAKTRVFNLDKNSSLFSFAPMTKEEGVVYVSNISRYIAPKLQYLEDENSLLGDPSAFIPMR